MNKEIIEGKWQQIKGDAKTKWGDLTDDDIDQIDGQREKLAGVLKEKYGKEKDEVEKEIDDWVEEVKKRL